MANRKSYLVSFDSLQTNRCSRPRSLLRLLTAAAVVTVAPIAGVNASAASSASVCPVFPAPAYNLTISMLIRDNSVQSFDFQNMKFQLDGSGSPHPTTIDFDTSFDEAARKALHIQGLVPPAVEGFSKQERRCEFTIRGMSGLVGEVGGDAVCRRWGWKRQGQLHPEPTASLTRRRETMLTAMQACSRSTSRRLPSKSTRTSRICATRMPVSFTVS